MKAALLTQLGQALGCDAKDTPGRDEKVDGFPARCWYAGPLEVARPRPPKVELERPTMMDREARFLAEIGYERRMRFILSRRRPA